MPKTYTLKLKKAKECKHSIVFEPATAGTPTEPNFATGIYIARACIPAGAETCTVTLNWGTVETLP